MRTIGLVVLMMVMAVACNNEPETVTSAEFKVWGNCSMCKETLEKPLTKDEGITERDWDKETKIMTLRYDTTKVSLSQIHKMIAATGYDTEEERGNDEAYENLHSCCQYDRKP